MSAVPLLIATTWLAGALGLAVILGRDPRSFVHLAQALILGPWLLAIEMLALNALGIPVSLGVVLVPWWVLGALAAKRMHRRSLKRGAPTSPLLVGVVGAAFLAILWVGLGSPITGGDPADNFAVFARTVAATQELDFARLQTGQLAGHLEYPPLLMLNESLYFQASGVFGARAVMAFFALQFLSLGLLFAAACRRVESKLVGLLLLIGILLQPDLFYFATHGFAELPLIAAFTWLIAEGCALFLGPTSVRRASLREVLAFALPALVAALAKNEGLMLSFASVGLLAGVARRPGVAISVALGTLLWPLLVHLEGLEGGLMGKLVADFQMAKLERFPAALRAFSHGLFSFDRWPQRGIATLAWGTATALGVALFCRATRRRALIATLLVAAHLAIYALVFALTPRDFAWHLSTAADRLTAHFVPWALLALWLWTKPHQRMKIGDDQAASPDSVTTRT